VTADAAARIDATQPQSNLYALPLRVDASPVIDTLLRFTVSGIGQGAVSQALLWLHVTEGSPSGGVVTLTTADWSETTVTWQKAPPRGAEIARLGVVNAGTDVPIDVSKAISGDGVYSFRMYAISADGASYRNRHTSTGAPRLELAVANANPSSSPTATPPATTTPTATPSPSEFPTESPSPTPTETPTLTPAPTPTPSPTSTPTPTPTPLPTTPQSPTPGGGGVPPFDHIFVIVEENKDYSQIIGSASAPYINSLASRYGLATDYHAIGHPSLPNYLALIGGGTFGITSDCSPSSCSTNAPNLADRIEAAGRSWAGYFESMPAPCTTSDSGDYLVHHDPFVYFDDIRTNLARCRAHVLPYTNLAGDLASTSTTPDFAFIVPNSCNDMHDCSVLTGDTWLKSNLPVIFASPAWTTQRSLVVVLWDENDGSAGNRVAAVLIGPSVRPAFASSVTETHYSVLRTIEVAWRLTALTIQDANAAPMSEFFP
jgi:acid phosphatase